jgi:hypothetical protein
MCMSQLHHRTTQQHYRRRLTMVALPVVILTRIGLWLLPASRLQALLMRLADANPAPQAHPDYAERAASAVASASKLVPGASDLTQALATLTMLRRRGLNGRLRMEVQRNRAGFLRTRFWAEHDGRALTGGRPAGLASLKVARSFNGDSF